MPWSRQRLDELTSGLVAVFEEGEAKVTGLKDLTGEVRICSAIDRQPAAQCFAQSPIDKLLACRLTSRRGKGIRSLPYLI